MASLKFQTRLTLVYLALFLLVQGIIIVAFYTTVTSNVEQQVSDQLATSARVFERIIDTRANELKSRVGVVARDFGFRRAVGTGDQATIRSALLNLSNRFDADLALVFDAEGNRVAAASLGANISFDQVGADPETAQEEDTLVTRIVASSGRLYETVLAPVLAPDLIGWVLLGQELDSGAAQEIKNLSSLDLDIAFLYEDGGSYIPAASTSGQQVLQQFLVTAPESQSSSLFKATLSGEEYMFWRQKMLTGDNVHAEADALIYFSIEKALAPYMALALTLSGVLAIGLVILVGGSVVISRGVTRPLRRLASAATQIAKGDYQEVISYTKDDEISNLTNSFNQMVEAVKEREDRIVYQAQHDSETGLTNRNFFEKQLHEQVESGKPFCVVQAEVQQVSELRSVLDHSHVNELMRGIGERIRQVAGGTIARLSTDVFVFTLEDVEGADVIASLIMNSFMTPFEITDIVVDVSIKMGMAKFPDDSKETVRLMQAASTALDEGRSSPRGFAWYVSSSTEDYKRRLSLMSELREALKSGEISFAYQPKLDLATDKVTSVEALVRWNSKSRGFVPPDEFIPLAEKTGDIRHLSEWGLREAVSQCAKWREAGRHISVAVNLSTSDLMNMNLPGQILALLREYGLPASSLKLEVTESAVMHDMARALDVLNMLSAMGLTLSIDDYGTGYSSLAYVKRLPVSELKIDKAFVLNLAESEEDRILVRSTIDLGHNLGLKVTAEGVEDQRSIDMLKEYGCDTLQGFFISRPVPAADLDKFLTEREE